MPLGKRTAKITKFYIEARTIGDFLRTDKSLIIVPFKKKEDACAPSFTKSHQKPQTT